MKYKHPNDKRIILCAVTAFICLAAFIAVILRICLAPDAPRVLFIVFILTAVGFLLSVGFLIRFCIERVRDKRNGVAIDRPISNRPLAVSEKVLIALTVISLVCFLISVVFMCYPGIVPNGVTAVLLLAGIAGYTACSLWIRFRSIKSAKRYAEEQRLSEESLKNENDGENYPAEKN